MTPMTVRTIALMSFRRAFAERTTLVWRVLLYLVIIGVITSLWRVATDETGEIAGYSWMSLVWYFAYSEGTVVGVDSRLIDTVGTEIATGDIAADMLRPISVVGLKIATEIGATLARTTFMLACGSVFAVVLVGGPSDLWAIPLAVLASFLGVTVNVVFSYVAGGAAFWASDSKAAWFLYQKLVFLLGGLLIPLQILPAWMGAAAAYLPFWTMSYAPARIASGHFEPWLLAGQVAWLLAGCGLASVIYERGERRLVVAGG